MEDRQRVYAVMAVVAIVVIVLSCIVGAAAGGVAGLIVGQEQGQAAAERAIARERQYLVPPEVVPLPLPEENVPMPGFEVPPTGARGALVVRVMPNTPAAQAGLHQGDVIVAVDRTRINAMHNLGDVLAQYEPDDRVTLTVWREGQRLTLRVVLGEHPTRSGQPYLGIEYRMNTGLDPDLPND